MLTILGCRPNIVKAKSASNNKISERVLKYLRKPTENGLNFYLPDHPVSGGGEVVGRFAVIALSLTLASIEQEVAYFLRYLRIDPPSSQAPCFREVDA